MRITYVGHATVLIEIDGLRLLTDPVLRNRVGHLRRHGLSPSPSVGEDIDLVLLSHLHPDHLDRPSLRRVDRDATILAPRGSGRMLNRDGRIQVVELEPGQTAEAFSRRPEEEWDDTSPTPLRIQATEAIHDGRRPPFGPDAGTIGFEIRGSHRIYFAGDTELFDGLGSLAGSITDPLDLALIPIWGWGPKLGPGHLNPDTAAQAVAMLKPKVVIPIHWGTLFPIGMGRWSTSHLTQPPQQFAAQVAELSPEVQVRSLSPGESTEFTSPLSASPAEGVSEGR